ncbi:MAG TPA: hypoxanthine phosphoribosyltransferase [Caldilineaceae bacterium]|nr:hypoxanthine phosphoribosyltransferase [Caldilineaceae bacterium]
MDRRSLDAYPALAPGIREVLLSAAEIEARVHALGQAISTDYAGRNPLLVGVLRGVFIFLADLYRAITIPAEVDFIAIASYSAESRDRGMVRLLKDLDLPIQGRHVIFVEDIVDTGLTLNFLLRNLRARGPASLEVCALFNKPKRRLIDIPLKYKGFDLPDRLVVGYGLDYREQYRNLPFLALLEPSVFQRSERGAANAG